MAFVEMDFASGGEIKNLKILDNINFTNSSPKTITLDFEPNFVFVTFNRYSDSKSTAIYKDVLNNKKNYYIQGGSSSVSYADTCITISNNSVILKALDDNDNNPNSSGALVYFFKMKEN